jgi:prevent-host-death family protein
MDPAGQGPGPLLSWDLRGHEGSSGVTAERCDVPSMCPGGAAPLLMSLMSCSLRVMEEMGIDSARRDLGGIVDRARLKGEHTVITRAGKPAAVVVDMTWYEIAEDLMESRGDQ